MKKNKTYLKFFSLILIILTVSLASWFFVNSVLNNVEPQQNNNKNSQPESEKPEPQKPSTSQDKPASGRYVAYSLIKISDKGYQNTILFFHASWCPECRAYEKAINDGKIPNGTQILKVDYDNSTKLRQKYSITLQSTFVSIDKSGDEISKWVGYGKQKTITNILKSLNLE